MEITRDMMLRASMMFLKRAHLKKDETVLIISEPPTDKRVIDSFFDAACQMGATPVSVTIPYRGVQNVEPARPLAVAMKNADLCLTVGPYESADYYTKASLEMLESGTRVLGWQSITAENLIQYVSFHDFTVTDGICSVIKNIMESSHSIKITCDKGTDISAALGERPAQVNPGEVSMPGDEGYLPPGVVGQAPIEESWNGRVVFDAFAYPVGILKYPITVDIKDGRITSITGREQAMEFKAWFESRNDPNIYIVAHYGFGINPSIKKLSELKLLNERMYGMFDIGFGTNDLPCFKGKVRANGHTDGLLAKATVSYDGNVVFEKGGFIHPDITKLLER